MRKLCVTLLLLAALPLAAADMTRLLIHVTDDQGEPVGNASVVVKFVKGRSKIKFKKIVKEWEMRTSEEGTVKVPELPQGEILIQVIARNHQTFGKYFDVDQEEKTVEIRLNPPQPQYSVDGPGK
jgi:hypothetical protein